MATKHVPRYGAVLLSSALLFATCIPASATGTARIHYRDGTAKTYTAVRIAIDPGSLTLTSSDGVGTLYIGKAACTKAGELLRCLPYDATLQQHGTSTHIPLKSGTVWLNLTAAPIAVPDGSATLAPRGVEVTMKSQAGTSISLTGTADDIKI